MSDDLTLVEKPCAVTMFDMKVLVSRDGRERGLWIQLKDNSEERRQIYEKWFDGAVKTFFELIGHTGLLEDKDVEALSKRFSVEMNLRHEVGRLLASKINEGALLEWDAVEEVYAAIGEELSKREGVT